ncbi:MAG: PmoA family protein [Pirellulaceae bacterium]|nr:PmoA family protein [Pirellulaceae bacterium]
MRIQNVLCAILISVCAYGPSSQLTNAAAPAFSLSKSDTRVVIKVGDQVFAEYIFDDPATNKTYLWPVHGPTGKSMTRSYPMKDIEGEVKDHYHHRGLWFGHQDIGGFNSWAEAKSFGKDEKSQLKNQDRLKTIGKQKHRSFTEMTANANEAVIVSELDYLSSDDKKNLSEVRTMIFRVDGETRIIDFNQIFIATDGEVTFGDEKDAGLCIRVPTTMSVDSKKGGKIINSEGVTDKEAWGKRAKWCDYIGPVEDEILGVAILNHPKSFRHPTTWHVRTYGLFTANPFGTLDPDSPNGPHTLKAGEKLELRHRFIFHNADFNTAKIEAAYQRYIGGN